MVQRSVFLGDHSTHEPLGFRRKIGYASCDFSNAELCHLQTISFSLYLYAAELYPTRLRAMGIGFSTAWLRAGSAIGPVMVGLVVGGYGIQYVFSVLAVVALVGGLVTFLFAIETKGQVLEKLSP